MKCSQVVCDKQEFVKRVCPVVIIVMLITVLFSSSGSAEIESKREKISLNANWLYVKADPSGAEAPAFNDAAWENVGVPHTFNDMDVFDGVTWVQARHEYWAGAVWYRKHFNLPTEYASGQRVYIEFEGVSQQADVWLNGKKLGMHKGSSVPFIWDITDYLSFGENQNTLAVRVDNSDEACSAVPGAMFWTSDRCGGIVRDVWLHVVDELHIPLNIYTFQKNWGTYAGATKISAASAEITVKTRVKNSSSVTKECVLSTRIMDADNRVVLQINTTGQIAAGETHEFSQDGTIKNPKRWSPASPNMYNVVSVVTEGDVTVDVFETPLGIRSFEFKGDNGFFLNGELLKLRGFGFRQGAYGGLTNAISNYLHEKDIRLAREANANIMRQGHSAVDPAVMNACDKYGLFMMDGSMATEVGWLDRRKDSPDKWFAYKKEFTRDIIIRDRNHPSVLLWDLGNGAVTSGEATELTKIIAALDYMQQRPTTSAGNKCSLCPRDIVDVIGTHRGGYECKEGWPEKSLLISEYGWVSIPTYRTSWQGMAKKAANALGDWANDFNKNTWRVGMIHWAFIESPGESHDDDGPCSKFGVLDANGRIPKEIYHAYRVAWSSTPVVYTTVEWEGGSKTPVTVYVSSHIKSVELFAGGISKGIQKCKDFMATGWTIDPGPSGTIIKAVGKSASGNEVAHYELKSYGTPKKILLESDPLSIQADGSDCAVIIATVVDENGIWHRTAKNPITFDCTGPVNYRGGFNHSKTNTPGTKTLYAELGKIAATIRSKNVPGVITISASSPGLESGTITIQSVAPRQLVSVTGGAGAASVSTNKGQISLNCRSSKSYVEITYTAAQAGPVLLELLDMAGKKVLTLVNRSVTAGNHNLQLKSKQQLPSGLFLICFRTQQGTRSQLLALMK